MTDLELNAKVIRIDKIPHPGEPPHYVLFVEDEEASQRGERTSVNRISISEAQAKQLGLEESKIIDVEYETDLAKQGRFPPGQDWITIDTGGGQRTFPRKATMKVPKHGVERVKIVITSQ